MVFSSHIFLFYFLPMVLFLYYISPKKLRHLILTILSYLFYGWTNPIFMPLMLASTIIDYTCGLVISRQFSHGGDRTITALPKNSPKDTSQRIALTVSIASNLALLGFFKYFNFGIDVYNDLLGSMGLESLQWQNFIRITLPLGISFYTFQSMSYSIDVYRGNARAIRNFVDFACYVAMFPQLVAGPIVRFHEIADQFENRAHKIEKFARGVVFFCYGLGKKILLANPCGKVADTVFNAGSVSSLDAWFGVMNYSFQIYFDFSGYSDMAIGLGLMFGFVFPRNFNRPYLSKSITELWQRWHLSLSHWLRDYLYIPLGGNRKGSGRTYVNLAMVMLLGGLWHGASWNFVIWGAIHGGMLAIERLIGKRPFYAALPSWLRMVITFLITSIAWVFFRAETLPAAISMLSAMFGLSVITESAALIGNLIYRPWYLLVFLVAVWVTWCCRDTWDSTKSITPAKAMISITLLFLSVTMLISQEYNPFIYFIF